MDVQRNSSGGFRNLRPIGPLQGPQDETQKRGSRSSGSDAASQESTSRRASDGAATPSDRQERIQAARRRRARLAQQQQGQPKPVEQSGQEAVAEENQGTERSERARTAAIRLRRMRLANAGQPQPTQPTPPAGDQVEISGGGLTVEQARKRIARLENFIQKQLAEAGQAPTTDPQPPADPPSETPIELPPAPEEGFTIEQTLKRIARFIQAMANGWVPGQPLPEEPAPAPQDPAQPTAPLERASGTPTVASPVLQATQAQNVTLPAYVEEPTISAAPAPDTFLRADAPQDSPTTPSASSVSSDSLVLSAGAAALSDAVERLGDIRRPTPSAERLAELRAQYEAGELNTTELIQRTAASLLTAEAERSSR